MASGRHGQRFERAPLGNGKQPIKGLSHNTKNSVKKVFLKSVSGDSECLCAWLEIEKGADRAGTAGLQKRKMNCSGENKVEIIKPIE